MTEERVTAGAEAASVDDRSLCGWRVRSDVPLDELLPWTGDDRAPGLVVRLGTVPAEIDDRRFTGRRLQVAHDGACRLERPGLATFLIRDGREVIVEPDADADPAALVGALLGPVLGIICYQRGLLPLHACCVEVDGVAVAIAGPRGAGKSTLAAAFMRAGHRLLTDDLTVIDISGPGAPLALPGIPRLKLTEEVLDTFGMAKSGLHRNHLRPDKLHLPLREAFQATPLPLGAVCHLNAGKDGQPGLDRLLAAEAVAECAAAVYGPRLAVQVLGRRALFLRVAQATSLLSATYRLHRTWEGPDCEAAVRMVAGTIRHRRLAEHHPGEDASEIVSLARHEARPVA